MKLLLDTHVLLWAASDPERLAIDARGALEEAANEVFVSAVTAWEVALKQSLGKLTLAKPVERWLPEVLRRTGFEPLSVNHDAAVRVRSLPWHHRDPFDRLLAAQALEGGYVLVSRDAAFSAYGVTTLHA